MAARRPLAALLGLALLILLAVPVAPARAADNLPPDKDPGGFLDLAWGAPLTEVPGLWLSGRDISLGGLDVYRREKAPEALGAAHLKLVLYLFWRGKLLAVDVQTQGQADYQALRQYCQQSFGPGYQRNRFIEKYFWQGPRSRISLQYQDVRQTGHLRIASRALLEEAEKASRQP